MRVLTGLVVGLLAVGSLAEPTHSAFSARRAHPAASAAKASFNCASRAVSGTGLEGFYRLGESAGATVASDSSGQARHGTFNGGVTLGVAPVNSNSDPDPAASFDSSAQQYVDTGGTFAFGGVTPYSVTLWFRTPTTPSSASLPQVLSQLQRDAGGNLSGWGVVHVSQEVRLVRYDAGAVVGSVAVPVTAAMLGTWQHYGFTYDGSTLRGYLNGAAVASSAATGAIPAVTASARIGGLSGAPASETAGWLRGFVDDVAIWSRVLHPAELRPWGRPNCTYLNVVDRTPGLLSHWAMDELGGTTLSDRAVSGATCALQGNAGAPSGLPSGSGTSLAMSTNDVVSCGQVHDFPGTAPFSVEAWFNMGSWNAFRTVVSKGGGTKSNIGWLFEVSDSQVMSFMRGSVTLASPVVMPKDTTWHHVVATYDGSIMRIFVDGAAAGSVASTAQLSGTTNPLLLGGKGGVDNTSIYARALSAAEVAAHYDAR